MNSVQQQLDEIALQFRKSMPAKLAEIESIITQLTYHSQNDKLWEEMFRRVHSLAGTAGTFGIMQLYRLAKALEQSIDSATKHKKVDKSQMDRVWSHFIALRTAADKTIREMAGKITDPACPITFSSSQLNIAPCKILVVSNNEYFAAWIKNGLNDDGHSVYTIDNPLSALALIDLEEYDFIISDVVLPEMSGQEFAKSFRCMDHNRYVPIIFLTSITDEMNTLQCVKSGGDIVLTKPVSMELLRAELYSLNRLLSHKL